MFVIASVLVLIFVALAAVAGAIILVPSVLVVASALADGARLAGRLGRRLQARRLP